MKRSIFKVMLAMLLAGSLLFAGCAGDDGSAGAPGADGADGAPGEAGQDGATVLQNAHASGVSDDFSVTVTSVAASGNDLVFSFTITGDDAENYNAITRDYRFDGGTMERRDLSDDGNVATLAGGANGAYTITVAGANAAYGAINSRYMFRLYTPDSALPSAERPATYRAIVMADFPAAPVPDVLGGGVSCSNCHGPLGEGFHYGYPTNGGANCVVCHDAVNTTYPRLMPMIHGIHNSHNMPGGEFTVMDNDVPPAPVQTFSIGFPSYMNNCSLCHTTDAGLALTNAEPVTYDFCMSCHGDWTGFGAADFGGLNHTTFTSATNCAICHDGASAPDTHAGMHNLQVLTTERGGLIWDGYDASVREGARVNTQFESVTRNGDDLAITWTATVDGTPVDPCNTTVGTSAPTWQSGFSILKAFYVGDDLVNAMNGNGSPGQPNSVNLDFVGDPLATPPVLPNTVCAANVATTTITLTAEEAALVGDARIGLQGRPLLTFAPSAAATTDILVRAKSAVYDYNVVTGNPAAARRQVVDNDKCLGCHTGSLYQHGGNRIDNEDLCIMCHNEASSEQNVREGYGVDASEAYDGKVGQTYGFKTMLHAIHASGRADAKPFVIYRTRGIYLFGPSNSPVDVPNWPGEGTLDIFGSDDGTGTPIPQSHIFVTAHFPRELNDCNACHVPGGEALPDQSMAVGTTVDAGLDFDSSEDDLIQGPAAAACTSCHAVSVPGDQALLMAHVEQMGWDPAVGVTREGALNFDEVETCVLCHQ